MLRNGAEVLFRSLDQPDRARGLNLAWFWLDEAPLCGYYAWQVLKARLRQPGYATAGWATGTPHGRDGFAHDFELAPRRNHALFRASTYANAAPPAARLRRRPRLQRRRSAQQEVLGLFVAFEGLVYAFDADDQGHLREHPAVGSQNGRDDRGGGEIGEPTEKRHREATEGTEQAEKRHREATEGTEPTGENS